ncbi:hypothetical protein PCASD_26827 [Puccinia coronata f. sp. avenae]|uniref:Uncharacterized protein n=1 Tax=Puccinia coronata f. sp. avenae TaxID=200324 RepID=A0A2N5RTL1_9BASI|nr:hypothetical protein PCASD_26827 [Puccinia coronata f. sp. avenae]
MRSIRHFLTNDDSDSDDSFHCCGRPEDLAQDPPTPNSSKTSQPKIKEVFVPENQDFYCYQSGIERQNQEETTLPSWTSATSSRASISGLRASTSSDDSQKTAVEHPLLVIKTGLIPSSPPYRRRSLNHPKSRVSELSPPRTRAKRVSLNILRASTLSRSSSRKAAPQSMIASKPLKTRFSLLQKSWRAQPKLEEIKEGDTPPTLQPQKDPIDLSSLTLAEEPASL